MFCWILVKFLLEGLVGIHYLFKHVVIIYLEANGYAEIKPAE